MQNIQIAYKPSALPEVIRGCLPAHFCDAIARTGANPIDEIRLHSGRILTVTSRQKIPSRSLKTIVFWRWERRFSDRSTNWK